ncbi:MAG TPA: hypothetical protein VHE60_04200 [Pyrinomonadaceae bacterium]|nr:hypothetical protein [Pyrinomonadaceae bacterium]
MKLRRNRIVIDLDKARADQQGPARARRSGRARSTDVRRSRYRTGSGSDRMLPLNVPASSPFFAERPEASSNARSLHDPLR